MPAEGEPDRMLVGHLTSCLIRQLEHLLGQGARTISSSLLIRADYVID